MFILNPKTINAILPKT